MTRTSRSGQRWLLDPVPTVLSSREWETVETGLIERAELLDLVLEDLYGKRDLLRRGVLRPRSSSATRISPSVGSVPLAWQTPAVQVRRRHRSRRRRGPTRAVGPQPDAVGVRLRAGEPHGDIPRLPEPVPRLPGTPAGALLPLAARRPPSRRPAVRRGPPDRGLPGRRRTAFEHAFLASALGYPLVEGSDLVTRRGRVWMRSLGQLEPVHVILRRVDAWFCDPLELKADSQLGVPGLVEAAGRRRHDGQHPRLERPRKPGADPYLPASEHLLGSARSRASRRGGAASRRPAARPRQYRAARVAADLPRRRDVVAVRLGAERRRARGVQAADRGRPARLGRAGVADDGVRSDAHASGARSAPQRVARVRGPPQRLLRRDARRPRRGSRRAATRGRSRARQARSARTPGSSHPSPSG